MGMHVGESESFESIQPTYQRHGVAIWSSVYEGQRLLFFRNAAHGTRTFCTLDATAFLTLSNVEIGKFIVELIGPKNSDDRRKQFVQRGKTLREILASVDDSQVIYMYFYLFYGRKEMTPPRVQFM